MGVSLILGAMDFQTKLISSLALVALLLFAILLFMTFSYWARKKYIPRETHRKGPPDTPDPWEEAGRRVKPDKDE